MGREARLDARADVGAGARSAAFASFAICVICVLVAGSVRAELSPPVGHVDSRVRATLYDGEQVYRLRGVVGYQIDLQFEAGETFEGLGAGDMEGLAYFGQDNHLFLKPKAAKVATNLTVLTNRRQYQFDYAVLDAHPTQGNPDVVFVLRFIYPVTPGKSAQDAAAERVDSALDHASAARHQNLNYAYCGAAALKPVAASDDGVHTRLRFAANADLPAIFVRNDDESESLLNFSIDDGDVIVHRVARRFILRRGKLTGCVVNQGFGGSGVRLESGTVTPSVERHVQVGPP